MTSPDARRFIASLTDFQKRLANLENSLRQPQLGKSSIQDDFLHVYDAQGQVRQRIGKQADGSFAVTYKNGPQPPKPTDPTVLERQLSLAVFWDGTFSGGADARPGDFARVDVHVSTTSGFTPDSSTVIGSLVSAGAVSFFADSEPHYVRIVAVNASEVASDATGEITATPMPATEIAAGSIGAEQLSAEIVLSSKLIAGDPDAARLELSATGVRQFDDDGQQTVSLGADPSQGNFLSIADPTSSLETLATLSDDGGLTVQKLAVSGDARFGGTLLTDIIANESGGCVARAQFDGPSPSTVGETAWFEVAFQAKAGRLYRIQSGPFVARNGGTDVRLRFTLNGDAPSTTSESLTRCGANNSETVAPLSFVGSFDDNYVRVLLSVGSWTGTNVFVDVYDDQQAQFWVEDIGLAVDNTGSLINAGGGGTGGSQPKPLTTYTTLWRPTWMQAFNQHGLRGDGTAAQGYYPDGFNGDNTIMIGFDYVDIQNRLAGSTINGIRFFIYSWHWYYNSGGYAAVGSHNVGAAPSSYSVNHWNIVEAHMPKPGGVWIGLPLWLGNEFRDNATKGINLDAKYRGHDLNYYGKFNWPWDANPPALEITYTK